jgi:alkanesulfonate monooxygenase SsuD/methylene tetrahydromethanopterin reductase-like flavin-dependent oxidoreductase (luciferase family)
MSTPTLNLNLDSAELPDATLSSLLGLITVAEDAGVTSVTLRDRLTGGPTRLDPLIAASALGPVTRSVGLIPEVVSAVTEPFHTATAIQTIDHASLGRAGLALRPGVDLDEHAAFGRWESSEVTEANVYRDADDTLEAVSRLWESWQDDAVIRDVTTDRFLDRTRIHDADRLAVFTCGARRLVALAAGRSSARRVRAALACASWPVPGRQSLRRYPLPLGGFPCLTPSAAASTWWRTSPA